MCWTELKLVKIHENEHLVDDCVHLLNKQWPRKDSIRLQSVRNSTDNFPMSLALVDEQNHVYGFVKLTQEGFLTKNLFVHSLLVETSSRRKGLGRFIMQEVEKLAKQLHFRRINLLAVADDNEGFYSKLGYCTIFNQNDRNKLDTAPTAMSLPPPPPPPPPPSTCKRDSGKTLMSKLI